MSSLKIKSHQIFLLIISLCKKVPIPSPFIIFFKQHYFFFLAEQHILILWIVILLEVFFEKSYLEPGSNSKMYWYPGLQNLFGLLHIKSFLQLTVQLFSPLPSHLEFFPFTLLVAGLECQCCMVICGLAFSSIARCLQLKSLD